MQAHAYSRATAEKSGADVVMDAGEESGSGAESGRGTLKRRFPKRPFVKRGEKKKRCVAVVLLFDIRPCGAAAHRSTSLSVLGLFRLCTSLSMVF